MEFPGDGPVYERPLQEVIANHSNALYPLYNVLTPAFDSTRVKEVRFGVYLEGDLLKARPTFQFSDDGVNWSASPTGIGLYDGTQGWKFQAGCGSVYDHGPKNFVRLDMVYGCAECGRHCGADRCPEIAPGTSA